MDRTGIFSGVHSRTTVAHVYLGGVLYWFNNTGLYRLVGRSREVTCLRSCRLTPTLVESGTTVLSDPFRSWLSSQVSHRPSSSFLLILVL
jgi:hypothetical protein